MEKINVTECPIKGLYIIEPNVIGDERGFFYEVYNKRDLYEAGIDAGFVQENISKSAKGVLRGLHFQKEHPQGKLARVLEGAVFDVAVDIREGSDTYGKWYGVELSAENRKQFFMPEGFAHGVLALTEGAVFCYKCTDYYCPEDEGGIAWNDPEIGIKWPGVEGEYSGRASTEGYCFDGGEILLSKKDQKWLGLKSVFKF